MILDRVLLRIAHLVVQLLVWQQNSLVGAEDASLLFNSLLVAFLHINTKNAYDVLGVLGIVNIG